MQLQTELVNDLTIVKPHTERIDAAVATFFKDAMRAKLGEVSGQIILDISEISFVDSSGLGALVAVHKMLAARDGLILLGLTEPVRNLLALTKMDTVFTVHADLGTALRVANAQHR